MCVCGCYRLPRAYFSCVCYKINDAERETLTQIVSVSSDIMMIFFHSVESQRCVTEVATHPVETSTLGALLFLLDSFNRGLRTVSLLSYL